MMFVPLRVSAAEQDQVILGPDGPGVAVSLNMSDAEEENITAVSVSLKVDAGGSGLAAVDFEFAPELSGAECGYRYFENSDSTGRLDIYAVTGSGQSLFREGMLDLGKVKITPDAAAGVTPVEVSYYEGSFQTANAAYGAKTPMVENAWPANIQLGSGGTPDPDNPGNGDDGNGSGGSDGSGSGDSGNGGGNSGSGDGSGDNAGNGGGDSNIDEGLYDENTQFKNDPSDAENIPSDIIGPGGQNTALPDMSKGLGNNAGIKLKAAGSGTAKTSGNGKVTVVAPEDGVSSILISKAGEDGSGTEEESAGSAQEEGKAGEEENGKEVEEIRLDQENGGVAGAHKSEKKSGLFTVIILAVIIAVVLFGLCIFLFMKKKGEERGGRKEPAGRKTAGSKTGRKKRR